MNLSKAVSSISIISCLCLSACTETIIKEMPGETVAQTVDSSQTETQPVTNSDPTLSDIADPVVSDPSTLEPAPMVSDPSTAESASNETQTDNMVGDAEPDNIGAEIIQPTESAEEPETVAVVDQSPEPAIANPDTTQTPTTEPVQENEPVLADPQTVDGTPGATVDCNLQLPCRWFSEDSQFSVTVTNADNIATRSRLGIQFSVGVTHDTQVSIVRSDSAIDSESVELKISDYTLGSGNGVAPQGVAAGSSIEGTSNFDQTSSGTNIKTWSLAVLDGGLVRDASFTNIPIGGVTSDYADCENTLPCVWVSPNNDVTITLLTVGGLSTTNRLSANLSVQTATNMTVAFDAGATAYGTDGTQFVARTHSLGTNSDYEKITANTLAGVLLPASIDFLRTATSPTSLQDLSLVIYNDSPVPRWNPRFTAVPIQ